MPFRDFIGKLQKELGEELTKKESHERSELDKDETIKKDGPAKWKALQNEVGTMVEQVNQGAVPQLLTFFRKKSRFSVQSASGDAVEVKFDPASANIIFRIGDSESLFEARVSDHAVCYLGPRHLTRVSSSGDHLSYKPLSIENMAEKLLSLLFATS